MNALNKVKKSGHKACINCVDGATVERNLLATGSEDQSVRLWDIRTDRAVKCIVKCFEESVEAVKFSPSDESVLYAASGKCLFSFDLRTDGVLITSPSDRSVSCSTDIISAVAVNPCGTFLAVSDDAGIVTIVDSKMLTSYKPKRLRGHSNLVNAIAFSPIDATSFVSGGFDYQLCSWDFGKPGDSPASVVDIARLGNEGLDEFSSKSVNPPFVQSLSFTCNGQAIAVALGDGSVSSSHKITYKNSNLLNIATLEVSSWLIKVLIITTKQFSLR
jgi:WD repeat-containing protein 53